MGRPALPPAGESRDASDARHGPYRPSWRRKNSGLNRGEAPSWLYRQIREAMNSVRKGQWLGPLKDNAIKLVLEDEKVRRDWLVNRAAIQALPSHIIEEG